MKALILRNDSASALDVSRLLMEKGFQILSVQSLATAQTLARVETIDLLVMDDLVAGQLTHSVALSAERRNPDVCVIAVSDRDSSQTEGLFELMPCLYAVIGEATDAEVFGKIVMSAMNALGERIAEPILAAPACAFATSDVKPPMMSADISHAQAKLSGQVNELEATAAMPVALGVFHSDQEETEPSVADIAFAAPVFKELKSQAQANVGIAAELAMIGAHKQPLRQNGMTHQRLVSVLG